MGCKDFIYFDLKPPLTGFNRNIMGCKDVKVEYIRVSRQDLIGT